MFDQGCQREAPGKLSLSVEKVVECVELPLDLFNHAVGNANLTVQVVLYGRRDLSLCLVGCPVPDRSGGLENALELLNSFVQFCVLCLQVLDTLCQASVALAGTVCTADHGREVKAGGPEWSV